MRISNYLVLGLAALSLTFCKRNDEVSPKDKQQIEQTTRSAAYTQFAHVIGPNDHIIDGAALGIKPGDVIGLEAGTRTRALVIRNFKGEPNKPIIFVNKGGKTTLNATASAAYGIKFENCQYFRVTGTGDDKTEYGIEVNGGHIGISMEKLSSNFELDHVEVRNCGFAGIMAKTDPTCDKETWRDNFTMRDLNIHHNYVHDVKGEGFYIGNSFYEGGRDLSCGNIKPHSVENVKLYNNKTRNTGCEGIQVGCVIKGAEIYNNDVSLFGQDPFAAAQNNGIQIGEGTGGKLYNNIINTGPGNGIIVLGLGDNLIYNNIVINPGTNGVFCDERYTPGPGFTFINNTFINPAQDGFKIYAEKVSYVKILNNIVVKPGSGKYINTFADVKLQENNNLFTNSIGDVKFKSAANNDYSILANSPAIDKGANVSSYGITFDFAHNARPAGKGYDIGAFEFGGTPTTDPGNGGGITEPGNGGGAPKPDDGNETPKPGSNKLPVIGAISNHTMKAGESKTVSFTLSDPDNDPVRVSAGNMPNFLKISRTSTGANFIFNPGPNDAGTYNIIVKAFDDKGGISTKPFTMVVSNKNSLVNAKFTVIEDAYLENGKGYNHGDIRVDKDRRTAYVKFKVEGLGNEKANKAILKLRVGHTKGHGPLKVYLGANSNWAEKQLTPSSAPAKLAEVGMINTTFNTSSVYSIDVTDAIKGDGTYTLILEKDTGGGGVSFSAKESGFGPQLIIN
jgi:hypothetical protein